MVRWRDGAESASSAGHSTNLNYSMAGPAAHAVGADGGCVDIFLSSIVSLFFLPLSGRRSDID